MCPLQVAVGPGALLAGRHRVVRELGRGGMGIVYLCRDRMTGEAVALKRLSREAQAPDPEEVWWFRQEARAVASLEHPSIVRGRDFGVLADGSPFLVMDVAGGRSLLGWLEIAAIPWPWPATVLWSFVDQILAGLAHAHARGVIHGDLKPTNLMIDFEAAGTRPVVKILDLGLASLVRDRTDRRLGRAGAAAPDGKERVVRAGAGTPGWMAPEQIRQATTHYGPPTDLYALGSILYHLASGREPFTGTPEEVLEAHRSLPIPELRLPKNLPAGAQPFILRLLEKRPWRRFEYAGDARRAWARFRPEQVTEPWCWAAEPKLVGDLGSLPEPPAPTPPVEIPAAPGYVPGLLDFRPSPLVARQDVRAELQAIVDEVCRPSGAAQHLVVLYGEAGLGKSRLAEWLCEYVHEEALMVPLRARYRRIPAPLDGAAGAVDAHYGLEAADRHLVEKTLLNVWEIAKDDDEGRTWVAATAEWLRPTPPGTEPPLGPSGKRFYFETAEMRRQVIFRALQKIGEKRPILMWLDDLHLASSRTFETLTRLRAQVPDLRLVLLATARSEAVQADAEAARRIDELRKVYDGRAIQLAPMTPQQTEELLRASLPLDPQAAQVAREKSKGNPLFALQLLHAWAGSQRLELDGGRWRVPDAVLGQPVGTTAELWDERLSALAAPYADAAMVAAALGGDIPPPVLRALFAKLGLQPGLAFQSLQQAEILLVGGPNRLRWPHALLQEHLLARLTEDPRAPRFFQLAADALAVHPAAGTRRIVSHRVTNLLRAGKTQHAAAAELVLSFVEQSWRRVRDVGATLNDLSRLEGIVTGPAAAAHERWKAEALRHKGAFAEARELAERARARYAEAGDAKNEAHCLRLLGHICSEQAIPGGRELVARALSVFESLGDEAGRAECEVLLGEIDYLLGEHDRARTVLTRASARCAALGDTLTRGQSLLLMGLVEQASGELDRARDHVRDARAIFDKLGYRLGIAQCDVALAHLEHRRGDLDAAIARARSTRRAMRDLENPRGEGACARLLAMALLDGGSYEKARERALEAGAIYDRLADPWGQVEAALLLAQCALASGNPIAKDLVTACSKVPLSEAEPKQHLALTQAWLAHVEKRCGDAVAAIREAREAFGASGRTGDHTPHLVSRLAALEWDEPARSAIDDWWRELGGF